MRISLLVIRCEDIEVCKTFYEKLGLSFQREQHGNSLEHYCCILDDCVFELYPRRTGEFPDNTRLGFKTPNIDKILLSLDIEQSYELNQQTFYILSDPEGRKIELS